MSLDKSLQTGRKIKLNDPTTNTIIVTVRHILHKKKKIIYTGEIHSRGQKRELHEAVVCVTVEDV